MPRLPSRVPSDRRAGTGEGSSCRTIRERKPDVVAAAVNSQAADNQILDGDGI
jgi:hypothetical protein